MSAISNITWHCDSCGKLEVTEAEKFPARWMLIILKSDLTVGHEYSEGKHDMLFHYCPACLKVFVEKLLKKEE